MFELINTLHVDVNMSELLFKAVIIYTRYIIKYVGGSMLAVWDVMHNTTEIVLNIA